MIIIVTARKAVIKLNRFPWPLKVDVYFCTINDIKDEAENQPGRSEWREMPTLLLALNWFPDFRRMSRTPLIQVALKLTHSLQRLRRSVTLLVVAVSAKR